jgi:hypothetical protein
LLNRPVCLYCAHESFHRETKGSAIRTTHTRRSLFREVNERIREIDTGLGGSVESSEVYCECGSVDCLERFEVPGHLYEHVRRDETLFLVKAGHESADEERVTAAGRPYRVVALRPATGERRVGAPLASARLELVSESS